MVLLVDGAGSPVTGVLDTDVELYYVKDSALASVNLLPAEFDWLEPDPVNMAGVYRLTINLAGVAANVLDTLGDLTLVLNDIGGTGFLPYPINARVVRRYSDDILFRLLGVSGHNYKLHTVSLDGNGFMTAGIIEVFEDNTLTTSAFSYEISTTYLAGGLSEQEMKEP
jgi:hypothetical protein